jgi:general secretion pathway protein C
MIKISMKMFRLLLVAAGVFVCVDLFYDLVEAELRMPVTWASLTETGQDASRKAAPAETAAQPARFNDYSEIVTRDLFQTAKASESEENIASPDLENLEKTKLNLTLWGTITGTDQKAYAVIENKSVREQQLYREGDTIEQARIKMILRKKVVLTVEGKDEILEMEEDIDQSRQMPGPAEDPRMSRREEQPLSSTVTVAREEINEAMQNINTLMRQIRIRPYFENGQPSGIMLSGIQSNSIFSEMGLESGDIVKGVNGRQIQSVEDAMSFYENLKSSSEVELEVQRDGTPQTIFYRID